MLTETQIPESRNSRCYDGSNLHALKVTRFFFKRVERLGGKVGVVGVTTKLDVVVSGVRDEGPGVGAGRR